MVEEPLVEAKVADSVSLLQSLESQGDKPSIVAWHYSPENESWRLLIAGPTFDPLLPNDQRQAIERILQAMQKAKLYSLSIGDFQVVRTDHPLLNAARTLVKTDANATIRAHLSDNLINGLFIKEMLVLRAA